MVLRLFSLIKRYPNQLLIIVALHFIIFSILGFSRHWGYMTSINDLGCFDQALWGTINDGFLLNTFIYSKPINWLGHHFNPFLYIFTPLYFLYPSVSWFIFSQSAALSLAALPIFLLAKQVTQSEKQAILWGVIYLLNPSVLNADVWDFHPVSLAVPLIALAFLAIEQQKVWLFTLANISLLLCQEQFGLTVACFGLLYGIKNKEFRISSLFFILGIVSVIVVLTVVMPNLSPTKQHVMFGGHSGNNAHLNRYGWLGHSIKEIVTTLVFSPKFVFNTVAFAFQGGMYLKTLFLPVLFTALAAPWFLLPMSADLLANILSAEPLPRHIFSYHSVTLIPVLIVAAIYGCQKIERYCSVLSQSKLTWYICISTIIFGYLFAPLPLPFAANIWQPTQTIAQYDKREDEIKSLIADSSVSAQINIGAHFSQREEIYRFPHKIEDSQYTILWLKSPTTDYDIYIYIHIQMQLTEYLSKIESLLISKNFKIAYWNDPWLVFKKEQKSQQDNREIQVRKKLEALKQQFQSSKALSL